MCLLSTAKQLEKEQLYLLIKLIVCTGLSIPDLLGLTLEMVQHGEVLSKAGGKKRLLRIPKCLQEELLHYVQRRGDMDGLLFVTRNGKLLNRVVIFRQLQQLCRKAEVSEEKGNLRRLRKLYQTTRPEIEKISLS